MATKQNKSGEQQAGGSDNQSENKINEQGGDGNVAKTADPENKGAGPVEKENPAPLTAEEREELENFRERFKQRTNNFPTPEELKEMVSELTDDQKTSLREALKEASDKQAENEPIVDQDEDAKLLKKYGPGYVKASRSGQNTIFTAEAWKRLGAEKEGAKDGWRPVVKTPPEVKALKNKKP